MSNFPRTLLFVWLSSMALLASDAIAATRYVSDNLTIYMRRGAGTDFKIESSLRSGAKLDLLSEESGWAKVKLSNGKEGYVLTRQLQLEPIARDRFQAAEENSAKAQSQAQQAKSAANVLTEERDSLLRERGSLERQNAALSQQLTELQQTASSSVEIQQQNEALAAQVSDLEVQRDALTLKADALHDKTRKQWFLVGGGVLLLGMILGLLLPHLPSRRRTDSWSSL